VLCVLFERGVLFCVICAFLCVVSCCITAATRQNQFAIQLNNNKNNNNNNNDNNRNKIAFLSII
jgi:hypothetical protein